MRSNMILICAVLLCGCTDVVRQTSTHEAIASQSSLDLTQNLLLIDHEFQVAPNQSAWQLKDFSTLGEFSLDHSLAAQDNSVLKWSSTRKESESASRRILVFQELSKSPDSILGVSLGVTIMVDSSAVVAIGIRDVSGCRTFCADNARFYMEISAGGWNDIRFNDVVGSQITKFCFCISVESKSMNEAYIDSARIDVLDVAREGYPKFIDSSVANGDFQIWDGDQPSGWKLVNHAKSVLIQRPSSPVRSENGVMASFLCDIDSPNAILYLTQKVKLAESSGYRSYKQIVVSVSAEIMSGSQAATVGIIVEAMYGGILCNEEFELSGISGGNVIRKLVAVVLCPIENSDIDVSVSAYGKRDNSVVLRSVEICESR